MLTNDHVLERLNERWWLNNPRKIKCENVGTTVGVSVHSVGGRRYARSTQPSQQTGMFLIIAFGLGVSLVTLLVECFYYKVQMPRKPG